MPDNARILIIPEKQIDHYTPCGWIRLIHPYSFFARSNNLTFQIGDWGDVAKFQPTVVVFQRLNGPNGGLAELASLKKVGIKFVYDLDDDLLTIDSKHSDFVEYRNNQADVISYIEIADIITVSTSYLLQRINSPKTRIIPNELADHLWFSPDKVKQQQSPDTFNALYFGTTSHLQDWNIISEQVQDWLDSRRNATLTIIGISEKHIKSHPRVQHLKRPASTYRSYPAFVHWISSLDQFHVGLAPLDNNEFNKAKSNLKALEYGALGARSLCSNLDPYRYSDLEELKISTLVCDSWFEALESLYADTNSLSHEAIQEITRHNFSIGTTSFSQMELNRTISSLLS